MRTSKGIVKHEKKKTVYLWVEFFFIIIISKLKKKIFKAICANIRKKIVSLRSEEHTFELQSHVKFVCRLLFESNRHHYYHLSFPTRRSSDLLFFEFTVCFL